MFSGQKIGCTFGLDKPVAKTIFVVPPLSLVKHLAGQHDQSSHGNWAHGEMPYQLNPRVISDKPVYDEQAGNAYYPAVNAFLTQIARESKGVINENLHQYPLSADGTLPTGDEYWGVNYFLARKAYEAVTGKEDYIRNDYGFDGKTTVMLSIVNDPAYPKMPQEWIDAYDAKVQAWHDDPANKNTPTFYAPRPLTDLGDTKNVASQLIRNGLITNEQYQTWLVKENAFVIKKLQSYKFPSGETVKQVLDKFGASQLDTLKTIVSEQPVTIQMTSARLARFIKDERFKTVYEVSSIGKGSARGKYLDSRERRETILGVPTDTPDEQRPVYGYVANNGNEIFGDVRLVLKDETKNRTTITVGDSMDGQAKVGWVASDVRDGKISSDRFWLDSPNAVVRSLYDSWSYRPTAMFNTNSSNDAIVSSKNKFYSYVVSGYVEAQVHGGIKLSDVSQVIIKNSDAINQTTKNKLTRAGIEIIVEPNIQLQEQSDFLQYGLDYPDSRDSNPPFTYSDYKD